MTDERVTDSREFMRGWIEQDAIDARPDHDGQIRLSVAVSLKRIADVLEGFGPHPDNANEYGETGIKALLGELRRFKNECLNDLSGYLRR